jgi:cbb3-type cytochrome oxidase maturation protein
MSVLFIVVPLALIVVLVAVIAYIWSARGGQFDDLDTPPVRMLHDDDAKRGSANPLSRPPADLPTPPSSPRRLP